MWFKRPFSWLFKARRIWFWAKRETFFSSPIKKYLFLLYPAPSSLLFRRTAPPSTLRTIFLALVDHLHPVVLQWLLQWRSEEAPVIGSVSPGRFLRHRHLSSVTAESSLRRRFSSDDRHFQFWPVAKQHPNHLQIRCCCSIMHWVEL